MFQPHHGAVPADVETHTWWIREGSSLLQQVNTGLREAAPFAEVSVRDLRFWAHIDPRGFNGAEHSRLLLCAGPYEPGGVGNFAVCVAEHNVFRPNPVDAGGTLLSQEYLELLEWLAIGPDIYRVKLGDVLVCTDVGIPGYTLQLSPGTELRVSGVTFSHVSAYRGTVGPFDLPRYYLQPTYLTKKG